MSEEILEEHVHHHHHHHQDGVSHHHHQDGEGERWEFHPESDGMSPLIRPGKDVAVIVRAPRHRLNIGRIVYYYRESGRFTLGRVVGRNRKNGHYHICGDNRNHVDSRISDAQITGVVRYISRGQGKSEIRAFGFLFWLLSMLMVFRIFLNVRFEKYIGRPSRKIDRAIFGVIKGLVKKKEHHHHHHHVYHKSGGKTLKLILTDITHVMESKMNKDFNFKSHRKQHHSHHRHHLLKKITARSTWRWSNIWRNGLHHYYLFGMPLPNRSELTWKHLTGQDDSHHRNQNAYPEGQQKGLIKNRKGRYFFMGLRLPRLPQFLAKKLGIKQMKAVNNNKLTSMDWSMDIKFKMPYNLPMQTLSLIVFVTMFIKFSMATWWLVYFLLNGNDESERVYMYNLLFTASWPPIIIFFIAYYYHLNKFLFMSINKITFVAGVFSLLRMSLFIYKIWYSLNFDLVTVFNMIEVACWFCIAGFFFIMHYKLTGREYFIPKFWLSKERLEVLRRKNAAKEAVKAEKRKKELREIYDHKQHEHVEH